MQQNNDLNFEPQDVNIVNPKQARKAVIATGIGNAMEWFDFGLYAYLAVILSQLFFSVLIIVDCNLYLHSVHLPSSFDQSEVYSLVE